VGVGTCVGGGVGITVGTGDGIEGTGVGRGLGNSVGNERGTAVEANEGESEGLFTRQVDGAEEEYRVPLEGTKENESEVVIAMDKGMCCHQQVHEEAQVKKVNETYMQPALSSAMLSTQSTQ